MFSNGPPHTAEQKQDGQLEHTYSSSMKIRDVALKTCQKRSYLPNLSARAGYDTRSIFLSGV